MKKSIVLIFISVALGVLLTFYVLNNNTYAKEDYIVYGFLTQTFDNKDKAEEYRKKLPSSIIIEENNTYKVLIAIYKDIDLVNEMVVYFENNNINIYLIALTVNKKIYNNLNNFEKIIKARTNDAIVDKINQSILNEYIKNI